MRIQAQSRSVWGGQETSVLKIVKAEHSTVRL